MAGWIAFGFVCFCRPDLLQYFFFNLSPYTLDLIFDILMYFLLNAVTLLPITNHPGRTGSTGKSSSVRQVGKSHPWMTGSCGAGVGAPAILSVPHHPFWAEPADVTNAGTHPHIDAADIVVARI